MNVFLTCAGRRNYLLHYFKEVVGADGLVLAGDASDTAPALQEADRAFVLPKVDQEGYVDTLLEICRQQQVDLLFSLNDLELPYLAPFRETFLAAGTALVISDPRVIEVCFDKWATSAFLVDLGLRVPATYLSFDEALRALEEGRLGFPLVVKPRWGSASIGISYCEDCEELGLAFRLLTKQLSRTALATPSASDIKHAILIQEKIAGIEYGLDIVNNLSGQYVTTFVKRKLVMRAGETDRAVTVNDPLLLRIGETLGTALGHIGNLDCDVMVSPTGSYVLELNPRFGGGYPFSHSAGANLPAALIAWAKGQEPSPGWLTVTPGVVSAKCDRLVLKTI